MPTLVGRELGRYHILEQLGEGGMATVYKAFDTRLERNVAFKVIRTERDETGQFFKRFEREAKSLAKLTHPNIVHVNDYGDQDGVPFLVMDFISGGTLKERLGKPMAWQESTRLILAIARALEYAHKHGIIHRDVKPANILITDSGEPMLSDFGVAKIVTEGLANELTGSGIGIGTPEYMAPEQVLGKPVDGRVDIYALGIVFYEMVAGRTPYQADTPLAIGFKQCYDALPSPRDFNPQLPEGVEHVLIKALAKEPAERYTDMSGFVNALQRLLDHAGEDSVKKSTLPASRITQKGEKEPPPSKGGKGSGKKDRGCLVTFLVMLFLAGTAILAGFLLFNFGFLPAPTWLQGLLPGLNPQPSNSTVPTPTPFLIISTPTPTLEGAPTQQASSQFASTTCQLANIKNPTVATRFEDGAGLFVANEWQRMFYATRGNGVVNFMYPGVQLTSDWGSAAFIGLYSPNPTNIISVRVFNIGNYEISLVVGGSDLRFFPSVDTGYFQCGLKVNNAVTDGKNGMIVCKPSASQAGPQVLLTTNLPINEPITFVVNLSKNKFTVFDKDQNVIMANEIPIQLQVQNSFWLIGDPWTDEMDGTNLQILEICYTDAP